MRPDFARGPVFFYVSWMGAADFSVCGQQVGPLARGEPISAIGNQVGVERRECAVVYRFQLPGGQVEDGNQGPAISCRNITSIRTRAVAGGERRGGLGFPVDLDSSYLRVGGLDQ